MAIGDVVATVHGPVKLWCRPIDEAHRPPDMRDDDGGEALTHAFRLGGQAVVQPVVQLFARRERLWCRRERLIATIVVDAAARVLCIVLRAVRPALELGVRSAHESVVSAADTCI